MNANGRFPKKIINSVEFSMGGQAIQPKSFILYKKKGPLKMITITQNMKIINKKLHLCPPHPFLPWQNNESLTVYRPNFERWEVKKNTSFLNTLVRNHHLYVLSVFWLVLTCVFEYLDLIFLGFCGDEPLNLRFVYLLWATF